MPVDRREHTIGIFLHLLKVLDSVYFNNMFDKLDYCGIREVALDWVKDYFSRRSQFVQLMNIVLNTIVYQVRSSSGFDPWTSILFIAN